jgi:pimeloyl-ACP methyl ester carboxylesterase
VALSRRTFLGMLGAAVGAGVVGAGGVVGLDGRLRHTLEDKWAYVDGPDLSLPSSGARTVTGSFESRLMHREVGWAYSLPAKVKPRAIVLSLYGKGANQFAAFDNLHLPDAAAFVGAPLAIASADGGRDNYWHKRADGTDAHAMLVEEFVPLLTSKLGALPFALHGYSMGGYGALLAAERGANAAGASFFKGVAASSPALWTEPGETAPGAFDGAGDFYANDVFTGVAALRSLSVRLDCGTLDPFFQAARQLSELMTWPHVAVFRPWATHTSGFWRSVAPAQMRFLAAACGVL